MSMVLTLGALLALTLWLQIACRVRGELAPLVACSTVVLGLYAAGLAGWLVGGLWVLSGICLTLVVSSISRFRSLSTAEWHAIVAVNATFIVLGVIAWLFLHDGRFSSWDEFSHWGRVTKAISVEGRLPTSSTGVLLLDYPPGAALFQYFVLAGKFFEGGTYFAQSLFLAAAALAVARWRGVRGLHRFAGTLVAVGLMLLILGSGFATVEVDHLLGAVLGAAVSASAPGDRGDSRTAAALVPVLCVLPLLKPVGLVFAMCAAGVVGLDRAVGLFGRGPDGSRPTGPRRWRWLALSLAVVVGPLVAHQSWQAHIASRGFKKTFDVQWSADRLAVLAVPSRRKDLQPTIVGNYVRAMDLAPIGRFGNGIMDGGQWVGSAVQVRNLPPPASARQWFWVLLAGSAVALLLHAKAMGRAHLVGHGMLAGGCLVYLALLLYTYLFGFGPYEGPRVISFGRYAGSWFLAWALAVLGALGSVPSRSRSQEMVAVFLLISVLAWSVVRVRAQPGSAVLHARGYVQSTVGRVERFLPQGAKTYVIWQSTTGLEFHLLAYELSPRRTNTWCWTLGETFVEGDVWSCPLSPQEWANALAGYEFVLVGHADERFWTRYQALFPSQTAEPLRKDVLFKVERSTHGVVLQPVVVR